MAEHLEIMTVYEGMAKCACDAVAILKTALELNITEDKVKEAIYGQGH